MRWPPVGFGGQANLTSLFLQNISTSLILRVGGIVPLG